MPLYRFKCEACNDESEKILSIKASNETIKCEKCGQESLKRQLPQGLSSTTFVTRDPHRGVQQPKDLQKHLKKRMRDHHDKYEVADKIEEHGMDAAIRNGWIKKRK